MTSIALEIAEKAKRIKLLICDVDGVLTDGGIIYDSKGREQKRFHVHDGQGLKILQAVGIHVAIITSRQSDIVARRMQELAIPFVFQGQTNKIKAYEQICQQLSIGDEDVAYLGDDLPDLALIRRVGLGVAVANAVALVRDAADWVTDAKGGQGAARELVELLLQAQNKHETILHEFSE